MRAYLGSVHHLLQELLRDVFLYEIEQDVIPCHVAAFEGSKHSERRRVDAEARDRIRGHRAPESRRITLMFIDCVPGRPRSGSNPLGATALGVPMLVVAPARTGPFSGSGPRTVPDRLVTRAPRTPPSHPFERIAPGYDATREPLEPGVAEAVPRAVRSVRGAPVGEVGVRTGGNPMGGSGRPGHGGRLGPRNPRASSLEGPPSPPPRYRPATSAPGPLVRFRSVRSPARLARRARGWAIGSPSRMPAAVRSTEERCGRWGAEGEDRDHVRALARACLAELGGSPPVAVSPPRHSRVADRRPPARTTGVPDQVQRTDPADRFALIEQGADRTILEVRSPLRNHAISRSRSPRSGSPLALRKRGWRHEWAPAR